MFKQVNLYLGEGALPIVQLLINFLMSCFEKHDFSFFFFQQLSLKLNDNCTSGNLPWIKISRFFKGHLGTQGNFKGGGGTLVSFTPKDETLQMLKNPRKLRD